MNIIFDFLTSALPWIAIGLFVATSCVMINAKHEGKKVGSIINGLCWSPAGCFLLVAVMEIYNGNTSKGITWLVLASFNAVINFLNIQKENR